MRYLKASAVVETLDEYNGQKGMFIKTFALNTERNKNGWRTPWPGIKKNIADFIDKPGIEYTKCTQAGCDLDHTEAGTYEDSLVVQEPFRVTNIIDYVLKENEETAFFVHKTDDAVFFEKVKTGEIKYVSPSVWPVEVVFLGGYMPNGEPILDVFDWKALHDAFVNDPAFGEDAKVVATCEGENCQMKMLSAKKNPELTPIPIMIKHKDKLHYVSVSAAVRKEIEALSGISKQDTAIMEILKNNSLNACACSSKIAMADKSDKEQLEAVQAALKAAEQSKKDSDDKVKDLEAKLTAATEKIEKMAKNGAIAACGKCGSTDHTTDNHTDENSKDASSKNAKALAASVKSLEAKVAKPMIDEMLKARTEAGATEDEIKAFKTSLDAKSLADIESQYNSEKVFMTAVSAKTEEKIHFDFNDNHALSAKTDKPLEEIFQEIA